MLRRIIRRAVRHALPPRHARSSSCPTLVDATVEVMGERVPRARAPARPHQRRGRPRGGALPPDPRTGLDILDDELVADGDVDAGRRRVPPARHARLPARADRARSRRSAASASTSTGSTHADGRAARRAPRRRARPRAARRRAPLELYRELLERVRPDRVHRARGVRDGRREGPGARRWRRAARPGRRRAARRRGRPRPHALLRRVRRPGRRHRRRIAHRPRRAGSRCSTRSTGCRASCCHRVRGRRGRVSREGDEVVARDRRRAPRRDPPQPHRHPPAALGAARGARTAREAGGLARRARPAALRLQPLRGGHAGARSTGSRSSPTARSSPTRRSATTRRRRTTRRASARSRSSATSTATSCACSRPASTRSSCAAAPTCTRSATSARSRS